MINKELISQSIDYIIQHLNENISVDDVANYFHFSKFYFCRSFKAVTGESVYEFIKRLKMDQSAVDIKLEKNKPITDIGLDYGYSSSNYSSAFRKHHKVSPVKFRKSTSVTGMLNPFYSGGLCDFNTFDDYNDKIKIQQLPDFPVIYERAIGNYIELKGKWFDFLDKYKDYIKLDTLFIERFYNDPTITGLNSCLYDICMTTDEFCGLDNVTMVKGGKFANYRFEGKIPDIFCAVQGIFSVWLPESGYEMDERYGLNIYRRIDKESECVIMDLCIPIK
ncbi:MAG: AraC family transcriptional regulator [Bacillota bacterium]|nr:AraC family transcriptional regulator [Bacillota bacterium]